MKVQELDRLISLVQVPTGDDATLRLHDEYTDLLVADGGEAADRVVDCIESGRASNVPVLMTLVAAFGNERAATYLAQKLECGPERITEIAAGALATYPTRWSLAALRYAIQSKKPEVVRSTLAALRNLDDRVPCDIIKPLVRSPDPTIRFHATHLASSAGCLPIEELRELAGAETDPDVQDVLRSLIAADD